MAASEGTTHLRVSVGYRNPMLASYPGPTQSWAGPGYEANPMHGCDTTAIIIIYHMLLTQPCIYFSITTRINQLWGWCRFDYPCAWCHQDRLRHKAVWSATARVRIARCWAWPMCNIWAACTFIAAMSYIATLAEYLLGFIVKVNLLYLL